ncbi:hypothetical protein BD626DRAFT_548086 [Schizophyllum amplum]|uniref:NAD(P)-binding protein n=1 Tax=Schizophyllum amplum TaxID=97359 RepID=A0A550CG13_9AGAR|nr:hypothetical protein BD626DRAFT_548086 [Auriculariopsis ampla]
MSSTVYLVTGAGRGIGVFGITSQLAARPDVVVFAGRPIPGRVHVIKVVSADRKNNDEAAQEIKKGAKSPLDTNSEEMIRHLDVNTNGPLLLFQAMYELLRASKSPKFVTVSSGMGSITVGPELPMNQMPYAMSKAALNWVTRKLHHDNPDMTIFPISPGGVDTDGLRDLMAHDPALQRMWEMYPLISVDESARGVLEQVDVATRETHSGQFVDYTGLGKWAW